MKKKQDNKPLPEGALVSDSFHYSAKSRFFKFIPKSNRFKKPVLIGVAILVIGVAGLIVWSKTRKQPDPIVLKVGKYSYTQSQYALRIAQAKDQNISEYEARKALKNAFASRQAADDLGIAYPTDRGSLNAEAIRYHKLYMENPTVNDYQRDTAYSEVVKQLVRLGVNGTYKVGYVEFPFARYIVSGDNSQFQNTKLINDDISYAKSQAEQSRANVIAKKQSITAVVDKARADNRLTYGQAGNMSDEFYIDELGNKYSPRSSGNVAEPSFTKIVKQSQVGKTSDLLTRTWSNSYGLKLPSIQHGTEVDVAYYFLIVETKAPARPTLQTDYDKRVQEYLR